jgi:hypothetical protein
VQQQQPPDPRVAALAERQAIDQLVGDYPRALDAATGTRTSRPTPRTASLLQGVSSKGRAAIKHSSRPNPPARASTT